MVDIFKSFHASLPQAKKISLVLMGASLEARGTAGASTYHQGNATATFKDFTMGGNSDAFMRLLSRS